MSISLFFPLYAFVVMLALGNVGVNIDYWGAIPFGLLIAWIDNN